MPSKSSTSKTSPETMSEKIPGTCINPNISKEAESIGFIQTGTIHLLNELTLEAKEFSLEANHLSTNVKALKAVLPKLFGKLNGLMHGFFTEKTSPQPPFNVIKSMVIFKAGDYMELRRLRVIAPNGIKVSYREYLTILHKAQDTVDLLLKETLEPFERYLGSLLNEPDSLSSNGRANISTAYTLHDIDLVKKGIATAFSKKMNDRQEYGALVGRQGDWMEILGEYNRLVHRLTQVPRDKVLTSIENIAIYIDTLILRIEEDPETYKTSGMTIKTLADISYAMAVEVEYYAVHSFMVEALGASLEYAQDLVEEKSGVK